MDKNESYLLTQIKIIQNQDKYPPEKINQSISILFEKYNSEIFNFLHNKLSDIELAEDATQEVFFVFFKNISNFKGMSSIRTWLYAIAWHIYIGIIKKKKKYQNENNEEWLISKSIHDYDSQNIYQNHVDNVYEKKDDTIKKEILIYQAIQKIPDKQRIIIQMRYINGMELGEISKELNLNLNTVKTNLSRAMKSLMKKIQEFQEIENKKDAS